LLFAASVLRLDLGFAGLKLRDDVVVFDRDRETLRGDLGYVTLGGQRGILARGVETANLTDRLF